MREAQILCKFAGMRVAPEQESNDLNGHILFHMVHI